MLKYAIIAGIQKKLKKGLKMKNLFCIALLLLTGCAGFEKPEPAKYQFNEITPSDSSVPRAVRGIPGIRPLTELEIRELDKPRKR
jgi:hypothetical protein